MSREKQRNLPTGEKPKPRTASGKLPSRYHKLEKDDNNVVPKTLRDRIESHRIKKFKYEKSRKSLLRKIKARADPKLMEEFKRLHLDEKTSLPSDQESHEEQPAESNVLDYEKLKNRIEILQKKNKKLEEEKNNLKMDKDQTMKTIENLLSQNRELTSENATLRDRQRKDGRIIDGLRKNVHLMESRMQRIKEENKILHETNLKTLRELQETNQEKKELNKSYRGQNEEINRLMQDKEKESSKLHTMESRYTRLKAEFANKSKEADYLKLELNKYKQTITDLREEIKSLKEEEAAARKVEKIEHKIEKIDVTDDSFKSHSDKSPVPRRKK